MRSTRQKNRSRVRTQKSKQGLRLKRGRASPRQPERRRCLDHDAAIIRKWAEFTSGSADIIERLTPGQLHVLREFLCHPNDRTVARRLNLCESTVRNHLYAIENKLNVASREHLVALCLVAIMRDAQAAC